MRFINLFILTILVLSCERDNNVKSGTLEADINNHQFRRDGYAYQYSDYQNKKNIGYTYNIFNLDDNAIYISIFDSTFNKSSFNYPDFNLKYSESQSNDFSKTYQAINGNINLIEGKDGNLKGNFSGKLINLMDNQDTVYIKNGYINIPLQKFNRNR